MRSMLPLSICLMTFRFECDDVISSEGIHSSSLMTAFYAMIQDLYEVLD